MLYVLFIYNLLLIVLYTVATTTFLMAYLRWKRPIDAWIALLFGFYIVDNTIIYMTEMIESFSRHYANFTLSSNTIKSLILSILFLCYGQAFKRLCNAVFLRVDAVVYLVFLLSLIVIPLFPSSHLTFWLYVTAIRLMLAYTLTRAYWETRGKTELQTGHPIFTTKWIYFVAMLLVVASMVEDGIKMLQYHELTMIHQRNISEDLYSVYIIGLAFWYLFTKNFSSHSMAAFSNSSYAPDYGDELKSFSSNYKMTSREAEVLQLLVKGASNQEISEQLFITLGTTKNHVHNIYKKCHVSKRSQLIQLIRAFY